MENMLSPLVLQFITEYGSFALFFLLALGIIGLPIPDETLILFTGYLIAKGTLSPFIAPLAVWGGSMTGITFSYLLGRFGGRPLALKYGNWLHITPERLDQTEKWFDKIGKWILIIGYYIPGVRHLAGFVVGTINLPYPVFAAFAYTGAFLWSATFMTLGYFFYKAA